MKLNFMLFTFVCLSSLAVWGMEESTHQRFPQPKFIVSQWDNQTFHEIEIYNKLTDAHSLQRPLAIVKAFQTLALDQQIAHVDAESVGTMYEINGKIKHNPILDFQLSAIYYSGKHPHVRRFYPNLKDKLEINISCANRRASQQFKPTIVQLPEDAKQVENTVIRIKIVTKGDQLEGSSFSCVQETV